MVRLHAANWAKPGAASSSPRVGHITASTGSVRECTYLFGAVKPRRVVIQEGVAVFRYVDEADFACNSLVDFVLVAAVGSTFCTTKTASKLARSPKIPLSD